MTYVGGSVPTAVRTLKWRASSRLLHGGIAALALVVATVSIGTPSLWGDEVATALSATRSLPSLLGVLTRVDAVHGLYYVFMHGWVLVFGTSPTALRLPSALAVAATAYVLARLCTRLDRPVLGCVAASVFALLPRTMYMAGEARGYALATLVVTCSVLVGFTLLRDGGPRRTRFLWAGLVALQTYLFLYSVIVLPAILVAALVTRGEEPARRIAEWCRWSGIGLLTALPVIAFALGQHDQISFLRNQALTAEKLLISQWFITAPVSAVAGICVAAAFVSALRRGRPIAAPFALAVAWSLIPPLLLLLANLVAPLYSVRYMSMTEPAIALLIALGITSFRQRLIALLLALALVAACVPADVAQRAPFAKDSGSDWAAVARYVEKHGRRGDAVVFNEKVNNARNPRLAMRAYPDAFTKLADPTLKRPYWQASGLRDETDSIADAGRSILHHQRVWLISFGDGHESAAGTALRRLNYAETERHSIYRDVIYLYKRSNT